MDSVTQMLVSVAHAIATLQMAHYRAHVYIYEGIHGREILCTCMNNKMYTLDALYIVEIDEAHAYLHSTDT